ncbi:hypothetical protein BDR04DRAFT_1165195 [Suillus decipiens]|nr:hypothetical protein BDR04DRAFT_1165195 [Suillus decipiens]
MASLLRMETALGQDVQAAITATEWLVRYLKREDEFTSEPSAKTNPNPTETSTSASIIELPDEEEEVYYDAIG